MSKLALLIGINYKDSDSPLNGCINDVKAVRKYLIEKRGYNKDNITVLRDDIDGIIPTRDNILYYLGNLIYQANTNNSQEIFFHFSGHGDNDRPDQDIVGEKDKKNEYLLTSDLNIVFDNEIREIIGGTGENGTPALNSNTIMYIIMDCCRSGTNTDLPYVYDVKNGKLRKIQDYKEQISDYDNKTVYSISGCADNDFATDGPLYTPFNDQNDSNFSILPNERAGGLLTISILKLLNSNSGFTYLNCLRKLRTDIQNFGKNNNDPKIQQPLLCSSIPVNVTIK
jgi:hypothetical protein